MGAAAYAAKPSTRTRAPASEGGSVTIRETWYNAKTDRTICCPLTTRIRGFPFDVAIVGKPDRVVPADQVKSLDRRARRAMRKGQVLPAELEEVRAKLRALVG
jgi:mRNA interferase MazF